MAVYFIRHVNEDLVKIGVAKDVRKRKQQLQTGNPVELELMGWIAPPGGQDYDFEKMLHRRYTRLHERGEWFRIGIDSILNELQSAGIAGFVPKNADAFEIEGRDKDAVPIYAGVCNWNDFEIYECCPFCGCMCGMAFQEASWMYHCRKCDTLTNFEDIPK